MMCAICRRDGRGFGYTPALVREDGPARKLCSMRCQDITARLHGMIDPNKHEVNALAAASGMGGEYVESIAKTDLAQWTEHEWMTLIDVVVTAFQDHLRQAYSDDPPF
jgi:hypothetical protein